MKYDATRCVFWMLALGLALPACDVGARTGLTIPEYRRDGGLDAPRDGGRDAPDSPLICLPGMFPLVPTSADVVFTIDRSGSMRLTIDGIMEAPPEFWRWAILRDALADAFADLDPRVNVGAEFYPQPLDPMTMPEPEVSCATTPGIDVPVSPTGRARILEIFRTTTAFGGTPTAEALAEASNALRSSTTPRRFIVLATDGGPNCNSSIGFPCTVCTGVPTDCETFEGRFSCLDERRTVDTITGAASTGIPVFVIGIEDPTRPDLADVMDRMAIAGGRPRMGSRRSFYSVRTAAELREALAIITSSISECGVVSPSVPADDSTFSLTIDGEVIPRGEMDGWSWTNRSVGELELFGTWCERAREPGAEIVAIVDDCPEP
jgi:hypothetical protein